MVVEMSTEVISTT